MHSFLKHQAPKIAHSILRRPELKIEESSPELHVAIGDTVSKSVSLHPMPADVTAKISQVKSHLFFMMGGQVVIVDPKNNEIVDVIK
jgi:hypothetical protein